MAKILSVNKMIQAKKFVYAKPFQGNPSLENFKIENFELKSELDEDEILVKAEYISVDPYIRSRMEESKVGSVILGDQIARVLKSANYKYPEGSIVFGKFGWTTHTILKPHDEGWNHQNPLHSIYLLPDLKKKPISYALGVLGIPGNTAYFGLLDILKPKPRETVAVSAAAGCVGSLVGQIAKIKECKVVGFTSSQEKCEYLVRELGFDYAFNYNSSDLSQQLTTTLPNGIDCYFDSVGGKLTNTILEHMNHFGRIAVGGCISLYNNCGESAIAPITHPKLLSKELKVEGFNVHRWNKSWADGIQQNLDWLREGKLIYNETISLGFENIPKAFIDMMNDENIGESIVKV